MSSVGLLPGMALVAGALCAEWWPISAMASAWAVLVITFTGWVAWWAGSDRGTVAALTVAFLCSGGALASDARQRAFHTPLRALLDREVGGFAIEGLGPGGRHDPLLARGRLLEDASLGDDVTTLRAEVTAVRVGGEWHRTEGVVSLAVGAATARARAGEWLAGRTVEAPIVFRRPSRYLDEGVPDFEEDLALGGTTLFGSVKSGLLVEMVARGSAMREYAARVRARVRQRIERWVAPHDALSAAIVTAVLIGDRSALPEETRLRLQAAGTYHVIAISGGNIAILAGLSLVALYVCGVGGRVASGATLLLLLAYAQVVTAGPSVWRATAMAVTHLGAHVLGHRSPPWHTLALAAAVIACARPLDVGNAGFILTFGATAALLEGARRIRSRTTTRPWLSWLLTSLAASAAVEAALLPVSAWTFSRVTAAGLVLNLVAVPVMGVLQVAGIVLVCLDQVEAIAGPAGWTAHSAASALVGSARLVEVAPWLAARVPPPSLWLLAVYYMSLAVALAAAGRRRGTGIVALAVSTVAIVLGQPAGWLQAARSPASLRVTAFDVGQGDATLVQFPDRSTLLVDVGGLPFGGGTFDMGSRVLSPALWALGIRRLDTLLLTHGDPDHIGGGRTIVDDFAPEAVWEGVPVTRHAALQEVLAAARGAGAVVSQRRAGEHLWMGGARIRVLHPASPDWERPRVRNDDSVVLEVVYGDVAVLLLGDVGADVERSLVTQLTPATHRILKVGHHGSRTSTSRELLEAWRPQVALISCGRGNSFGHPAPEVVARLELVGTTIYRTDLDGQIGLETDGVNVRVRTFVGGPR